jgi:hypothetical protein
MKMLAALTLWHGVGPMAFVARVAALKTRTSSRLPPDRLCGGVECVLQLLCIAALGFPDHQIFREGETRRAKRNGCAADTSNRLNEIKEGSCPSEIATCSHAPQATSALSSRKCRGG